MLSFFDIVQECRGTAFEVFYTRFIYFSVLFLIDEFEP